MRKTKILYISYDGALDPLGQSQILPYIFGLSQAGIRFTLLTYEKKQNLRDIDRRDKLKKILEEKNIRWEIIKYHKTPTIPATAFDIAVGIIKGFVVILCNKVIYSTSNYMDVVNNVQNFELESIAKALSSDTRLKILNLFEKIFIGGFDG